MPVERAGFGRRPSKAFQELMRQKRRRHLLDNPGAVYATPEERVELGIDKFSRPAPRQLPPSGPLPFTVGAGLAGQLLPDPKETAFQADIDRRLAEALKIPTPAPSSYDEMHAEALRTLGPAPSAKKPSLASYLDRAASVTGAPSGGALYGTDLGREVNRGHRRLFGDPSGMSVGTPGLSRPKKKFKTPNTFAHNLAAKARAEVEASPDDEDSWSTTTRKVVDATRERSFPETPALDLDLTVGAVALAKQSKMGSFGSTHTRDYGHMSLEDVAKIAARRLAGGARLNSEERDALEAFPEVLSEDVTPSESSATASEKPRASSRGDSPTTGMSTWPDRAMKRAVSRSERLRKSEERRVERRDLKGRERSARLAARAGMPPILAALNHGLIDKDTAQSLFMGPQGQRNQNFLTAAQMEDERENRKITLDEARLNAERDAARINQLIQFQTLLEQNPDLIDSPLGQQILGGLGGSDSLLEGDTGGARPESARFSMAEKLQLEGMQGYTGQIMEYAREQRWPRWKLDKALRDYGGTKDANWFTEGPAGQPSVLSDWLPFGRDPRRAP